MQPKVIHVRVVAREPAILIIEMVWIRWKYVAIANRKYSLRQWVREKYMQDRFEKIIEVVHLHMETPSTSWSIGSFGAIAEFHVDEDETMECNLSSTGGTVQSERGAICIKLSEEIRAAPYEILQRSNHRWLHGVNFCVSESAGAMAGRDLLNELGGDKDALRVEDRGNILFDMGLGIPHVDVCVRTGNQDLIRLFRENAGTSMRAPDNPAMGVIKERSPHRVFLSRLGRVEVYQQIGSSAKGIPTPPGPHTHLLPRLLKHRRTHAANVPVLAGCYPSLSMYPANPTSDDMDNFRPFDAADHQAFQELLDLFGDPAVVALKRRTVEEVRQGKAPLDCALDRYQRTAVRVALRQLYWTDGESETLSAWRDAFETVSHDEEGSAWHGH